MALVTVQVLEGLERGRVYRDVETPITIGREDENSVQLNDERVSRFHAKMQEDGERIILTDLQSTNGTRVNGHAVQLRVLRPGDQVGIGRCLLLFGSEEQIRQRAQPAAPQDALGTVRPGEDDMQELFPSGPPGLPSGLAPIQRARLADVLSYAHDQVRKVLVAAHETDDERMTVEWTNWQQLLHLEKRLAEYLGGIADPE